jgi:hypothetical protein
MLVSVAEAPELVAGWFDVKEQTLAVGDHVRLFALLGVLKLEWREHVSTPLLV